MTIQRLSAIVIVCLILLTNIPNIKADKAKPNTAQLQRKNWVDSVYNALKPEERIGQLFMVAAYSGGKNYNDELISKLIANHQIGGLIFMQGGPARQAILTNKYQHMAQVPMLISMDAEWGLGMRLDSVKSFPRQMMLGATRDTNLVYRMGAAIAAQCKRLGVNIDFAPDVDVNNNPANPVINTRSFGEDKTYVARMGVAYMRGLQRNGVIACAKHFPGHGDTNTDSHKDLPLIMKTVAQLDTMELVPFRALIAAGVKSVMVAHLEVPALDTTPHVPTTLSRNAVTSLLKEHMGYNGLVITDALAMQGVAKYFPAGEADLKAFKAGNDILLFSQDVPAAITKIKNAIDSGSIPMIQLEVSVKKILASKYDQGLNQWKDLSTDNIVNDLNLMVDSIRTMTARAAITLVKDDSQILDRMNDNMSKLFVGVNTTGNSHLYERLKEKYSNLKAEWVPKGTSPEAGARMIEGFSKYDAVIVAVHGLNYTPGNNNYGLGEEAVSFLAQAGCTRNVMMVLPGNAYAMQYFCGASSVMVGYEDDSITQLMLGDALLKKFKPKGKLPVTACLGGKSICPAPAKLPTVAKETSNELRKVWFPADAGVIDMGALDKLDLFVERCIQDGAFPGCRVLAARDGKVFFNKSFGYHTYGKARAVDTTTLYDMASCTKMLATNICVMKLYEDGKLDLEKTLGDYLPMTKGTDKADLKIKDLLLHQAGLKSWIPFFKDVVNKKGKLKKELYRKTKSEDYSIQVAEDLWERNYYPDTMWARILASPLENKGKSVYSDLDFYFMAAVVEQITGTKIDKYVEDEFYKPMGLTHILYKPLSRFDTTHIAPTEIDLTFRNQLVHGYVHDPGAAMLGGVAGHAGIFATANDVAVIFQMLLNKGINGKTRYLKASTVELFTAYQSPLNHRGYGFDKPATDPDDGGPAGARVSAMAFGHQGFTGTCVWADPATGIVFVFQSNRVYPSADNSKINKLNVRTLVQDYLYESLGLPVNHTRGDVYKVQVGKK